MERIYKKTICNNCPEQKKEIETLKFFGKKNPPPPSWNKPFFEPWATRSHFALLLIAIVMTLMILPMAFLLTGCRAPQGSQPTQSQSSPSAEQTVVASPSDNTTSNTAAANFPEEILDNVANTCALGCAAFKNESRKAACLASCKCTADSIPKTISYAQYQDYEKALKNKTTPDPAVEKALFQAARTCAKAQKQ